MRVLLFAMPDTMHGFSSGLARWPNIALCSLASNAPGHEVLVGDLCMHRHSIVEAATKAIAEHKPDLVGLTAMSFQYYTAKRLAEEIRKKHPDLPLALGGYHGTLNYDEITQGEDAQLFDFIIRGEGEGTFAEFLDTFEGKRPFEAVKALSFRKNGQWVHNEGRGILPLTDIKLPDRSARLWTGFKIFTKAVDVLETSRGCTMPCNFCSISKMYGRVYRAYPIERVIADIADAKKHGADYIGFIDDNITLEVPRFMELCDAIVKAGLDDLGYFTQASSAGIGSSPEVAKKMAQAGFRVCFLGIENVSPRNLKFMHKGQIAEKSKAAIGYLHDNNILVIGGMIIGHPDDREEDIAFNYDFFLRSGIEMYHDQILQPYPKTTLREELLRAGLVTNPDDFRYYSGYWANVKTRHLGSDDIQFLRWKYRGRNSRTLTRKYLPPFNKMTLWSDLFYRYVAYPAKQLRWKWINRGKTEREVYRDYTRRIWRDSQFFQGKPPSPHLRVLYDDNAINEIKEESPAPQTPAAG